MAYSVTTKSITAVTAAAVIAGLAVFLTATVPEAKAEPQVTGAHPQPLAKGDRLPLVVKGAACSTRGWPHYEQSCQFDLRRPINEMPTARVIALR